jgi:multidrug efflux system membrane fusion protein
MNQPSSQQYPQSDAALPPAHAGGGRSWIIVLILLAIVGGGGYWLYRSRAAAAAMAGKAPNDKPVPVLLADVEQKDVPLFVEGLGNALPTYTVTVHTQVNGPLLSVNFKEGQFVHKGDLIAQVDPRPYIATLHQAEGALARDQATLKNAQLDLERYRELRQQKLIAEQQYTAQVALVNTTLGTIATDQAAIESARLNVEYSRIVSPIDGVTGVRLIDQGNLVQTSDSSGLVVITQLDPITVLFTLPEDDLPLVQLALQSGPLPVDAYSRDGAHKLASGTLSFIDNQINQTTATIRLRATFPNPKSVLWPNEFVKARLLLSTEKDALVVPAAAIQRGPTGTYVYLAVPDPGGAVGPDGAPVLIAQVRKVEIGSLQGEIAIVKSGLTRGEHVVADGQAQLKPDSKVAPRAPDKPADPTATAAASASGGHGHHGAPPAGSASAGSGKAP